MATGGGDREEEWKGATARRRWGGKQQGGEQQGLEESGIGEGDNRKGVNGEGKMGRGIWEGGKGERGGVGKRRRRGKRRGDFTDGYDGMPGWTWAYRVASR